MRVKSVDDYVEEKFGKPDYLKSFIMNNQILTPLSYGFKIYRVDPIKIKVKSNERTEH